MHHSDFDAEDQRFGSARFATRGEIKRAGLLDGNGIPIGYFDQSPLHLAGDAPVLTVAGSGAGKTRDLLAYEHCAGSTDPAISLDPKGEQAQMSLWGLAARNIRGYCWSPVPLPGLPQHPCNPLDILSLDSPSFHADCQAIMRGVVPVSRSENRYFEQRAQEWLEAFAKARVEQNGQTSLPDIYEVVGWIEGNSDAWADQLEFMFSSQFVDVRRIAGELLYKQQDAPKEFGAILGEISAHLSCLNDPALRNALKGGFSLSELIIPRGQQQSTRVYLNTPAEYLRQWSPILRTFFIVSMMYKTRAPQARCLKLIIDEAGQLGSFEALLRAFTFGRGAGIRVWALFQDIAQIERNLGRGAVQTLMGSAQCRQFFGVRDYETAKLVSDMLGNQTLEFNDMLWQERARQERRKAARNVLWGADPFSMSFDHAHYERESRYRSKQSRPLRTPDEILRTPDNQQYLFISGANLPPLLANKYPHYERREMAGRYFPNHQHPPIDSVLVKTRLGSKRVRVSRVDVPERYRSFPQYDNGYALGLEGYPL